jgi:hypothetical protein
MAVDGGWGDIQEFRGFVYSQAAKEAQFHDARTQRRTLLERVQRFVERTEVELNVDRRVEVAGRCPPGPIKRSRAEPRTHPCHIRTSAEQKLIPVLQTLPLVRVAPRSSPTAPCNQLVTMRTATLLRAEAFARIAEVLGPCELVNGEIIPMSPGGLRHSETHM